MYVLECVVRDSFSERESERLSINMPINKFIYIVTQCHFLTIVRH